jgi:hypothetical protein
MRENDLVLDEIAERHKNLRKTIRLTPKEEFDNICLHDRLMSEIKKTRILKPIKRNLVNQSITSFDSARKRIRPVKVC